MKAEDMADSEVRMLTVYALPVRIVPIGTASTLYDRVLWRGALF